MHPVSHIICADLFGNQLQYNVIIIHSISTLLLALPNMPLSQKAIDHFSDTNYVLIINCTSTPMGCIIYTYTFKIILQQQQCMIFSSAKVEHQLSTCVNNNGDETINVFPLADKDEWCLSNNSFAITLQSIPTAHHQLSLYMLSQKAASFA